VEARGQEQEQTSV